MNGRPPHDPRAIRVLIRNLYWEMFRMAGCDERERERLLDRAVLLFARGRDVSSSAEAVRGLMAGALEERIDAYVLAEKRRGWALAVQVID